MSFPFSPQPAPNAKPAPKRSGSWAIPALGVAAMLALAGNAKAGGTTYGSAQITLGFPNAQITLGHVWTSDDRTVEVYDDHDESCDRPAVREDDDEDDGDFVEHRVIVIHHRRHSPRKVVVVEQREPDRVVVVRPPERRVVIVRPEEHHREIFDHGEHRDFSRRDWDRGSNRESGHVNPGPANHNNNGGNHVAPSQPSRGNSNGNSNRDLFGTPSNRPSRDRGVQR